MGDVEVALLPSSLGGEAPMEGELFHSNTEGKGVKYRWDGGVL